MLHIDAYRVGIFSEGRVDYGSAHIVSKKKVYSGGMGRFWEGRISKGRG